MLPIEAVTLRPPTLVEVAMRNGRTAFVTQVSNRDLGAHFQDVVNIEEISFPPTIRDSPSYLVKLAESSLQLFLLASVQPNQEIVGYLAAERLELFDDVPGIRGDSHFGLGDSIYLASVAVLDPYRHNGIAIAMTKTCISLAREQQFKRVTAHVREGSLQRMQLPGRVIRSFPDWYQLGVTYDYIELPVNLP